MSPVRFFGALMGGAVSLLVNAILFPLDPITRDQPTDARSHERRRSTALAFDVACRARQITAREDPRRW